MSISDKLTAIAENEQKVFDAGVKSENGRFWDEYQRNGNRVGYKSAFAGAYWGDGCFRPKYDMRPTDANLMFQECWVTDLAGILKERGVVLDLSNCTNVKMAFYWCRQMTNIPTVDTTATTDDGANGTFYYLFGSDEKLQSIEKIILKQSGEQEFNNTFSSCSALREIRFEGVIGRSLNLQNCFSLTADSMKSAISHLKNYAGTEYEQAYTFKLHSVSWADLERSGTAPDGGAWKDYVKFTLGWAV